MNVLREMSPVKSNRIHNVPFSAAHLLASAHSTSRSSSRSDLLPTNTTARLGLANALASASHLVRFEKESRLRTSLLCHNFPIKKGTYLVIS
jgi:hypothetical protein